MFSDTTSFQIHALKELGMASARIDALSEVLQLFDTRRQQVVDALDKHGKAISPPWQTTLGRTTVADIPQPSKQQQENAAISGSTANDLRASVLEGVYGIIGPGVLDKFSEHLVKTAVEESFRPSSTDQLNSKATNVSDHQSLSIATKLIKELSLSREEVASIISRIERDHGGSGLRQAVNKVLDKEVTSANGR